jgi:ubiquinone/menaquinone biosynthesis C-methylase UbiE
MLALEFKHEKVPNMTHRHRGKSTESYIDKDIILGELNIRLGQAILDAGCGNGYMSKAFARVMNHTGKVYALDPDREAIETLKEETKGTNIETIIADITKKIPIEEASIDLIYLSTVIHGFQGDQISNFQKEAKRLLKPNARLAIVEIQKQETPFGPPLDIRYSPQELIQTIAFRPTAFVEVGQFFYLQIFENK